MKRIYALLLIFAMLLSTTCVAATTSRFPDVADTHWALEYIEGLADGGLVQGNDDGTFNPDGSLTVAQMATIVANAKGVVTGTENGYWAYKAIDYCINTSFCLLTLGDITTDNYDVECTREVAVYMIVKGLGASATTTVDKTITEDDIPDYKDIDYRYDEYILDAYQWGLLTGTNSLGTFAPKSTLTRAEVCAILYRAGYTEAAEKPDTTGAVGETSADVFAELSTWDEFTISTHQSITTLTADALYGGITIQFADTGLIKISIPEVNQTAWLDGDTYVDMYGNVLAQDTVESWYNANGISGKLNADGVMQFSSGFTYEARMFMKEVFKVIFPYSYDDAYDTYFSVLNGEIYEDPCTSYPSAIRWVDGRMLNVCLNQITWTVTMTIGEVNDLDIYETVSAGDMSTSRYYYTSYFGSTADMATTYEFDRG